MKNYFLLFVIFMCGFSLSAQNSYDFEILKYEDEDNIKGFYSSATVKEKSFSGELHIYVGEKASYPVLGFYMFKPTSINDAETKAYVALNGTEGLNIEITLSNAEIFRCEGKGKCVDLTFICPATHFKSERKSFGDDSDGDKECKYFMTQLRKYNIAKIHVDDIPEGMEMYFDTPAAMETVNEYELNTPGFRSAVSIDAMCKGLIAKTGDDGQYGSSPSKTTSSGISRNNSRTKRR